MRKAMFAVSIYTGEDYADDYLTLPTQTMVSVKGVMITNPGKMCSNNPTLSRLLGPGLSSQHNNARTNGAVFLRIRKIKNPNFSLLSA